MTKIIVNGCERETTRTHLSYNEVLAMQGEPIGRVLSVTWRKGQQSGSLFGKQTVRVVPGLVINVFDTSNA